MSVVAPITFTPRSWHVQRAGWRLDTVLGRGLTHSMTSVVIFMLDSFSVELENHPTSTLELGRWLSISENTSSEKKVDQSLVLSLIFDQSDR